MIPKSISQSIANSISRNIYPGSEDGLVARTANAISYVCHSVMVPFASPRKSDITYESFEVTASAPCVCTPGATNPVAYTCFLAYSDDGSASVLLRSGDKAIDRFNNIVVPRA